MYHGRSWLKMASVEQYLIQVFVLGTGKVRDVYTTEKALILISTDR